MSMSNGSKTLLGAAEVLILVTGLIHIIEAPDQFSDAVYKGWLFYANGLGALLAALGMYREKLWGWNLGLAVAGGAFIGYVASRTVGLPLVPPEPQNWLEPAGVVSLCVEAAFVVLYFKARPR